MLILTPRNVILVKQVMVNKERQIVVDRTITLGAIRYVSATNLKDDWFSLGVGAAQEPDPLLTCILKTEFFTHLYNTTRGATQLKIGPT